MHFGTYFWYIKFAVGIKKRPPYWWPFYYVKYRLEPKAGVEPTTRCLQGSRSAIEPLRHKKSSGSNALQRISVPEVWQWPYRFFGKKWEGGGRNDDKTGVRAINGRPLVLCVLRL